MNHEVLYLKDAQELTLAADIKVQQSAELTRT